jgi:hypothetical protein
MHTQAIANAIMMVLAVGFWTTGLVAGPLFATTSSGCFLTILLIVVICVVVISSRIDVVARHCPQTQPAEVSALVAVSIALADCL